jgi:mannose-1-phosphate guanylyltransferase
MKALLLAGGYGTRLRPLTDNLPKCLMPIGGKPLLEIWLQSLSKVGVNEFLINTHYLHEQVEKYIESSSFSSQVTLVHEENLLGTAGTLINNRQYWESEECLFIAHADNYCLADFVEFRHSHDLRPNFCSISMMTFRTEKPQDCGVVLLSEKGVVLDFYEKVKNPPSNIANGAIYIFSKDALKKICLEYNDAKDISTDLIPKFKGHINTYFTGSKLIDIGTPHQYRTACDLEKSE